MKHTNKSQSFRIYQFMRKGMGITPLQALSRFGCFRLAARIHELRSMGINVIKTNVVKNNKQFAQYSIN
jgi:Helix-turn-helix domain